MDGTNPEAPFFQPSEEYVRDLKRFKHNLNCFKNEVKIAGDYNTAYAKQLVIRFEKCSGKPLCATSGF